MSPTVDDLKQCSICKEKFPATLEYFYKKKNGRYGVDSTCKVCNRKLSQTYKDNYKNDNKNRIYDASKKRKCSICNKLYSLTPEYFYKDSSTKFGLQYKCKNCRDEQVRKLYLKRQYGITIEDYKEMFNKYKGRCWICGTHQTKLKRRLFVDHNHKTSKVRGLLCHNCNTILSKVKDNSLMLLRAIKYLKSSL